MCGEPITDYSIARAIQKKLLSVILACATLEEEAVALTECVVSGKYGIRLPEAGEGEGGELPVEEQHIALLGEIQDCLDTCECRRRDRQSKESRMEEFVEWAGYGMFDYAVACGVNTGALA